jgi:hypothetical protein
MKVQEILQCNGCIPFFADMGMAFFTGMMEGWNKGIVPVVSGANRV